MDRLTCPQYLKGGAWAIGPLERMLPEAFAFGRSFLLFLSPIKKPATMGGSLIHQ